MEKKQIKNTFFFSNGNTCCFDENGEQIPELQKSFLSLWAEHAESLGFVVDGVPVESQIAGYARDGTLRKVVGECWTHFTID